LRYKEEIIKGSFISRPNRFIAHVQLPEGEVVAHVKNTGRCRELLLPGAAVFLAKSDNPLRKTLYDLIAVYKGDELINIDSQAPNKAAAEYLAKLYPEAAIRAEVKHLGSRFDFYMEENGKGTYVEVKGVTLEREGVALFPDAPTERGARHIRELRQCIVEGCGAMLLFVVQMKGISHVTPNAATDPAFAREMRLAKEAGVQLMAVDCIVTENTMQADLPLPVIV